MTRPTGSARRHPPLLALGALTTLSQSSGGAPPPRGPTRSGDNGVSARDPGTPAPGTTGAGGWNSNLEIRHLRAFVALVDEGSLTRAARAMGVAQSTVSEALAALERALGTSAVGRRRGGHGITLTPAGLALLPYARHILGSLDDAHTAVAEATHDGLAGVDIIANESVSSYLLPPALAVMRTRWPNTRFAVSIATCTAVQAGVEASRFDVGIWLQAPARAAETASASTRRVVLPEVPLTVFAQPSHPLFASADAPSVGRGRQATDRNALLAFPLYMSDAAGDFHALLAQYFTADALGTPRFEASGSIEGVKQSVASFQRAVGILPSYAMAAELRAGTFRAFVLQPAPPAVRLDAVTASSRPLHPAIHELLEELARGPTQAKISRAV
ncbi:MAG: LysR family transcriptional regulator [bacterium]